MSAVRAHRCRRDGVPTGDQRRPQFERARRRSVVADHGSAVEESGDEPHHALVIGHADGDRRMWMQHEQLTGPAAALTGVGSAVLDDGSGGEQLGGDGRRGGAAEAERVGDPSAALRSAGREVVEHGGEVRAAERSRRGARALDRPRGHGSSLAEMTPEYQRALAFGIRVCVR